MGSRNLKRFRLTMALLIVASLVGCDQATKRIATRTLQNEPSRSYLNQTVRLQYALNPGGFLSVGSSLPDGLRERLFIGLNVVLLGGVAAVLWYQSQRRVIVLVALSSVLAGGVGNLIDRVGNDGLVIDFISLGVGSLQIGVFNVADVGVMCGTLTLLIFSGRGGSESCELDD